MSDEGDKDVEKQDKVESTEARTPVGEDSLQSTKKAAELEAQRLEKLKAEREKLGHLSIFSLGSEAVLEIVDSATDLVKKVFKFDSPESQGEKQTGKPEPKKVIADEQGRLSKVVYPSGLSAEVRYESPGREARPEEIKLSNGTTLKKQSDGSWTQTADKSSVALTEYRDIEVSSDGTIKFEGADSALSWNAAGTKTVTDHLGRLNRVTYPSGLSAEISYNNEGQADQIILSNDTTLARNSDDTWSQKADRSGVVLMEYQSVAILNDGTIKFEGDGYTLSWNPDGSKITTDQHGNLSKAFYASGLSADIKYDRESKDAPPVTIKLSNDTTLERNADGSWHQKPTGSSTILTRYKSVQVASNGTIAFEGDGYSIVWRPDGTSIATDLGTGQMTRLHADGTREKLIAPQAK